MEIPNDNSHGGGELLEIVVKVTHEAKLRELLHNFTSVELKLCSDASKEFIKLLRGESGGELLRQYVRTSSQCSELLQAWKLRQGKPGLSSVLSLVSAILGHPDGRYKQNDPEGIVVSRALDKFARLIVDEKLEDLYKELDSKEAKQQNAALSLLASIVRRGSVLASDVAKNFNFKMPMLPKLAECRRKKYGVKRKHYTRKSFIGFAMSFLELGKPGLLRWVLQQKEMFSGVLRGLGSDDEETVVYVLSTLRDRVLTSESLVPPGLRSVLFGSVTLEQLILVSGREDGGPAAEIAHNVLLMVCTDPSNGLMPDFSKHSNPLKGNPKRLLDLMKKLKAIEVSNHKELLLAVVKGRLPFGSQYLNEFPYNLEDHASPSWFNAVCLAAEVISSVSTGLDFSFMDCQFQGLPSFESPTVQSIVKCIGPRSLTRLVINKGLLHSNCTVKHGALRFVLEALKLLESFFTFLDTTCSISQMMFKKASLREEVQSMARIVLPDSQVLLALLSSLGQHYKHLNSNMKREVCSDNELEHNTKVAKKLKISDMGEDINILVSGMRSPLHIELSDRNGEVSSRINVDDSKCENDQANAIEGIWGLVRCSMQSAVESDETYFYSKLLEVLKIYHRIIPEALQGSFDFFKILPKNMLTLPTMLQQSLLSMLIEHVGWSSECEYPTRPQPHMYKHLRIFIDLMMYSPVSDIRQQAYILVQAAMLSTGAFDINQREIDCWFLFIPGYCRDICFLKERVKLSQNLSLAVVNFLCDAVSTTGNNLFKYLAILRHHTYHLKCAEDLCPGFSPLAICVLEKCLRLISSESGTFTLPERSLISIYVCNTISYLLQIQVEAGLLSSLIVRLLSERMENHQIGVDVFSDFPEWWPLKNLLQFSRSISDTRSSNLFFALRESVPTDSSFVNTLDEVKRFIENGCDSELIGVATAFCFSMVCTAPSEIVQNLPSVVSISKDLLEVPFSVLVSILFSKTRLLGDFYKRWPELFTAGVELALHMNRGEEKKEETTNKMDISSLDCIYVDLAFFLKQLPFDVLFAATISIDGLQMLEVSKLQNLLLAKVAEGTTNQLVCSFHHVLFWMHQLQLSKKTEPLDKLEKLSELCFIVVEHIMVQLFADITDSDCSSFGRDRVSICYVQEMAENLFGHPLVTASLECPLYDKKKLADSKFDGCLENFLCLARQGLHAIDLDVLNLLRTTSEHSLLVYRGKETVTSIGYANEQIAKAFKRMVDKLLQIFKEILEQCIKSEDLVPLVPILYSLHSLINFICPFLLIELANWILSRVDLIDGMTGASIRRSVISIGLHIAGCSFDMISTCLQQQKVEKMQFNLVWDTDVKRFDASLFETTYFKVINFCTSLELEVADLCLLKAVNVVKVHKCIPRNYLPFSMVISRVIAKTPVNLVAHCIHRINKIRGEVLYVITQMSPLHLSVFGKLFSEIMDRSLFEGDFNRGQQRCTFSSDDFTMLLPTVLSFLDLAQLKFGGRFYNCFNGIPSFYQKILLCSFPDQKRYMFANLFDLESKETFPSSIEEILNLLSESPLGKALTMLQHYFNLGANLMKLKKRLKLFNSFCEHSSANDHLLDSDVKHIGNHSLNQSLNFINRTVAKLIFCRMLLFPEDDNIWFLLKAKNYMEGQTGEKDVEEILSSVGTEEASLSRIHFLNLLVNSWRLVLKKFPVHTRNFEKVEVTKESLFRLLETFIFITILELTKKMHNCLTKLPSLPFVEELVKLSLLHRFEDHKTLNMLRSLLTSLSKGKFSCNLLKLLLAHSQFVTTVVSASKLSVASHFGMIFRPMSSILRLVFLPSSNQNIPEKDDVQKQELCNKKLEVIKLLRILFRIQARPEKGVDINTRELLSLLLSSYSATTSQVDLEIYNLMSEIEAFGGPNSGGIAEFDYIWGDAAIKFRKECKLEQEAFSYGTEDLDTAKEHRRMRFRESLPVDPKICAITAIHFPYGRTMCGKEILEDNSEYSSEEHLTNSDKIQTYDPVFLLRFCIHCMSMGYIEPIEFASLGLLANAFVTISSPDYVIRKLGYETLGKFKGSLEKCQKRKDLMRLHLLLTYLQNSVEEPWQRIPSITAMFLAESSCHLLDPSNDHYSTISKLLMHSPSLNMKGIPLLHDLFWSSSVCFKSDRLWILRLLYVGLNLDDDLQIYVRNSIFEMLLSFFASSLADDESKILILQVVKKSVKQQKRVRYVVERFNLIPWLSSLLSFEYCKQYQEQRSLLLTQLTVVLEVLNHVVSSCDCIEWLQKCALEQLTEVSSHLISLLVDRRELIKERVPLVISSLQILTSTLNISQKREVYQPQFTLSGERLFQIFEAIDAASMGICSPNADFGLKTIIMSSPPMGILCMEPGKFSKFITWATSTALQYDKMHGEEPYHRSAVYLEDKETEESLVSKLLRWLAASAIFVKLSWIGFNSSCSHDSFKHGTLRSLLEHDEQRGLKRQSEFGCEETFAAAIFHLHQLIGLHCPVLPSVVSALSLLLFPSHSYSESDSSLSHEILLSSLCSRIRCPAEVHPSWRWSYNQPWRDLSYQPTDEEKMDEIQACQSLLVVIANMLGRNSSGSEILSYKDVLNSDVYLWERSLMKSSQQ